MPPDRISLAGLEKLLDSGAGGPVPASVRQKDNNIFIRLNDPADLDLAKSILESKAGLDSVNIFNSISRPTKLYPAVALFVDFSYLPSLKDEFMLRNFGLKGNIDSVSKLLLSLTLPRAISKFFSTVKRPVILPSLTVRLIFSTPPPVLLKFF
jgi:hypothetical protein